MANRMTKAALIAALQIAGVEFPPSATVPQLRRLFSENNLQLPDDADNAAAAAENHPNDVEDAAENHVDAVDAADFENAVIAAENVADEPQNAPAAHQNAPDVDDRHEARILAHNYAAADVDLELDRELAQLQKRREILRLRQEIDQLQQSLSTSRVSVGPVENAQEFRSSQSVQSTEPVRLQNGGRKVHFSELDKAIVKFSGDDRTYAVSEFVAHLEQIFQQVEADEVLKLLTLRNSLSGTARLLLTRGSSTYEDLKASLLKEFGRSISRPEVYQALRNRLKRSDESVRRYVLEMESIAYKADVTEFEVVAFIQEGLNNRTSDYSLFAKNIDELKRAVDMYEQRQAMRGIDSKSDAKVNTSNTKPKPKGLTINMPTTNTEDRCYNCSRFGHRKIYCPYEERPRNACFNCWLPGHDHKSCKNRKYEQKRKQVVAAVCGAEGDEDNFDEEGILNALQRVSVAFIDADDVCSGVLIRFCLLDTGSPTNLVQRGVVPFAVSGKLHKTKFYGLGGNPIYTYGKISCFVAIRHIWRKLSLFVVPDDVIPVPLLLGRSALKIYNIELKFVKQELNFNFCANKKVMLSSGRDVQHSCSLDRSILRKGVTVGVTAVPSALEMCAGLLKHENRNKGSCEEMLNSMSLPSTNVDGLDICPLVGKTNYNRIRSIIVSEYLFSSVKPQPLDYEAVIRLNSDVPFNFAPRRLSFKEKEVLQGITDDLLNRGVIRPSDSAYASPVVMVQKKTGGYRKCIDFRCLNKMTIRDNYPLPLIEDCLEYFNGKCFFTTLDLKNGFFHVKLAENSKKYTSFVTPYGQFEYNRMPFGLTNAPAIFQRYIHTVLKTLISSERIIVYIRAVQVAARGPHVAPSLLFCGPQ